MFLYTCRENRKYFFMTDSINGVNIPSLQNNKPVNFQQTVVTTPMQGIPVDQEKLKQAANDNYISNRVRASEGDNPLAKLGIGTAIWYALAQLMDRINPKMGGDFEKSIGGKVAGFGDRISKTWVGRKVDAFLDWFGTKSTKMAEKSQIVNSLKYHSTSPEWGFAKMPAKGLYGFWSMDAEQVLGDYLKPIGVNAQKLEQFGLTQAEINEFVKGLPVDNAERLLAIQKKELELLGAKPKAIESVYSKHGLEGLNKFAEGLKVKDMGIFKGPKEFKEFKFADNPEKTLKIFENLAEKRPNWKVSIWRNKTSVASNKFINTVGKITKAIFGEKAADKAAKNAEATA